MPNGTATMPRGGAREGAGRPTQRITLTQETAHMLRELTRTWREREPAAHWTARAVVEQLVFLELDRQRREGSAGR